MKEYLKRLGLTEEDVKAEKIYPYNLQQAYLFFKEIADNKKVLYAVGDYDVDGLMSIKILDEIAKAFGIPVFRRIPKRFSEGYGLSEKIVDEIPYNSYIVTIDNGIAAKEAIIKAKGKGCKIMIMDHHLPPEDYEKVADIVYDCHMEDGSTYHDYCGAGMAYKFAEYIWGNDHPFCKTLCVYAMIATIADSVPLLGDNRRIVKQGIRYAKEGFTPRPIGLLMAQSGIDNLNTQIINYKIAPMLNAPGRLRDDGAQMVSDFLALENDLQAEVLAGKIFEDNENRKMMLNKCKKELEPRLENTDASHPICLHIENLSEGFLGLIAGWISEKYNTAAFVTTNAENGEYKGSARGNGSIHIKEILEKNKDILIKFGGHEGAGGFSLMEGNLLYFHACLLKENCYPIEKYNIINIDQDEIPMWRKTLDQYEPFGMGFPEPHFNCNFTSEVRFGKHYETNGVQLPDKKEKANLRLFGNGYEAFGYEKTLDYLALNAPKKVNLTGTVATNVWNGNETVKLMIDEIKAC